MHDADTVRQRHSATRWPCVMSSSVTVSADRTKRKHTPCDIRFISFTITNFSRKKRHLLKITLDSLRYFVLILCCFLFVSLLFLRLLDTIACIKFTFGDNCWFINLYHWWQGLKCSILIDLKSEILLLLKNSVLMANRVRTCFDYHWLQ